MHASNLQEELTINGMDVLDVLRWELYLKTRKALTGPSTNSQGYPQRLWERIRFAGYSLREMTGDRGAKRQSDRLHPAEVIFWPCEPTHLQSHVPVMAAVAQQGHSTAMIVSKPRVFDLAKMAGVSPMYAPALSNEIAVARRAGKRHAARIARVFNSLGSAWPQLPKLEKVILAIEDTFMQLLPDLHATNRICQLILEQLNPRAIIVGNDLTHQGHAMCLQARKAGIKTACMQHGSIALNPLNKYRIANLSIMYGENARSRLIESGLSPNSVVACGAPYLDNRVAQTGKVDPTIAEHAKLDASKPYVLIASSGPGSNISLDHHLDLVESITRLSAELPEIEFVVKLHRKDRAKYFEDATSRIPGSRLRYVPHGTKGLPRDIFSWLQGAAALITGASTVAVEAMLLSVPVITVDLAGELTDVDFINSGATIHCQDYQGLVNEVRRLVLFAETSALTQEKSNVYLNRMFYQPDGKASHRAASAIGSLFNGQTTPNCQN